MGSTSYSDMKTHAVRFATLILFCAPLITAQAVDDSQLKQVIILGRHGVRSPSSQYGKLDTYSVLPFPTFGRGQDNLTLHGATDETIFGSYYRLWLAKEGLLTGNDDADAAFVYFWADNTPLIIDTATAFWLGMLPNAAVNVQYLTPSTASDPLFEPVGAGVARLNQRMAIEAVKGRLGDRPDLLSSVYAPELALTRSVLLNYPLGENPVPPAPDNTTDVTALPVDITAGNANVPVNLGGLSTVNEAIDPFVMEYADGLSSTDVGWGQLTLGGINQISRLLNEALDLEYRTPYLDRVQSSNLASHIVRSLLQSATGNAMTGALATPSTKVIVLMASNTNVTGLAGLFQLDWILPTYEPDVCAPGGTLVFELRQSQSTAEYFVRASYRAQTMDQLRNITPLTLDAPPPFAPVFIPGCSVRNATFDCPLASFVKVAGRVIDPRSTDVTSDLPALPTATPVTDGMMLPW
jgi:4-phytase / acid phosphatase